MKAWVITVTYLNAFRSESSGIRVIAVISARKSSKHIRQCVEQLCRFCGLDLPGQIDFAKGIKPAVTAKATAENSFDVYCERLPYVFRGQLSEIMGIKEEDGIHWLRWKGVSYQRYSVNPATYAPADLETVDFPISEAPHANLKLIDVFT